MAKLIELNLILTHELVGDGTKESPSRRNLQAFTEDGTLVFEYDAHKDKIMCTANLLSVLQAFDKD